MNFNSGLILMIQIYQEGKSQFTKNGQEEADCYPQTL